jgi:glycosyltransferase involved in cell wall biosynthesis
MRVAMITSYPVNPSVVPGGVTAVAHYLVKGLARRPGVDLHVICCQRDVPGDIVEERDGATIHFLADTGRFSLLLDAAPQRRRIAALLRRLRPDVAHAQGFGVPTGGALAAPCPNVVTVHGIMWREAGVDYRSRADAWRWRMRARSAYRQALRVRNIIVTSGYVSEVMPPRREYRQFVIRNAVGDAVFDIQNRPTAPHVLVVGGLRHRKDPLTAVKVMERVLGNVPDATMAMLGPSSGTSLDQEVADYVSSHGLDGRIKLLGLVPDEVLREQYTRASLLLLTSLEETAPVAISEASAVGLPVVGTRAGGIPHLVRDGATGFVCPAGDVEGLAGRVTALLTDPALRSRMARSAREDGEAEYRLDSVARRTVAVYEEILGDSCRPVGGGS